MFVFRGRFGRWQPAAAGGRHRQRTRIREGTDGAAMPLRGGVREYLSLPASPAQKGRQTSRKVCRLFLYKLYSSGSGQALGASIRPSPIIHCTSSWMVS